MSQRDPEIALRQMLDYAREAMILSKGKSAPPTIVQPRMATKFSGEPEDLFAGKAKIMVGPEDSGAS